MGDLGNVKGVGFDYKIKEVLVFEDVKDRKVQIVLTDADSILIVLDSHINKDLPPTQQTMHLTKESLGLIFLGLTKAEELFKLNTQELLRDFLQNGEIGFAHYDGREDNNHET